MSIAIELDDRRILALLERLDPEPQTPCAVAGCVHLHVSEPWLSPTVEAVAA